MNNVTIWLAFSAGILAFISPCTLPLYPSFISFITGISVRELEQSKTARLSRIIFTNSLLFLLGFSLIYYILGYSASMVGSLFTNYRNLIRMIGAVFIGLMGLFMLGFFQPKILMKEFRFPMVKVKNSFISSFLVGLIFAAGWTPCIGPIFGSIIYSNVMYPGQTFVNITAYASGFGVPFLIMAFFIGKLRGILKYSSILMKIGGGLLLCIAVLLYTDRMTLISIWFQSNIHIP